METHQIEVMAPVLIVGGLGGHLMLLSQVLYTENMAEAKLNLAAIGCILLLNISI